MTTFNLNLFIIILIKQRIEAWNSHEWENDVMGRIKSVTLLDLVNRFPFVAAVLHALVYSVVNCFSCEVHVTLFGAFRHTNFEDFAVGLNCSDSALEVLHLELFNNYQFMIYTTIDHLKAYFSFRWSLQSAPLPSSLIRFNKVSASL